SAKHGQVDGTETFRAQLDHVVIEIERADRVQRRIERLFVNRDDQFHRNVPRGEARVCDESWSARLFPVRGAQTRPAICGSTTTAGEARSSCAQDRSRIAM